jgi:hypothetical protein
MFALLKRQFVAFISPPKSAVFPVVSVTSQPLIMRIRRHKMNKMKYLKRVKRDWWQLKKRHGQKKQRVSLFYLYLVTLYLIENQGIFCFGLSEN